MQKNIILNAESKKVRQTDGKMSLYSTGSYVLEGPQLEDPKRWFTRIYNKIRGIKHISVASSKHFPSKNSCELSYTMIELDHVILPPPFFPTNLRVDLQQERPTVAISSSAAPESAWHKCPIRTAVGNWEGRFVLRFATKIRGECKIVEWCLCLLLLVVICSYVVLRWLLCCSYFC